MGLPFLNLYLQRIAQLDEDIIFLQPIDSTSPRRTTREFTSLTSPTECLIRVLPRNTLTSLPPRTPKVSKKPSPSTSPSSPPSSPNPSLPVSMAPSLSPSLPAGVVALNVGGTTFQSTQSTLSKIPRFASTATPTFFDRDPRSFAAILNACRRGLLPSRPARVTREEWREELCFWGIRGKEELIESVWRLVFTHKRGFLSAFVITIVLLMWLRKRF